MNPCSITAAYKYNQQKNNYSGDIGLNFSYGCLRVRLELPVDGVVFIYVE